MEKNSRDEKKKKSVQLRNSTAEFLIFSYQSGGDGVEVRVQDGTIWLSQKQMGYLFDTSSDNISLHLKNIFKEEELHQDSVTEEFSVTAEDGKNYRVKHYNLDAIIAVGYRVNSKRATAFRQWATGVLRDYALHGYLLDRKRMENGAFLDEDYFEHLLEEIREIRLSERRFYQKITDIYSTAMDYDKDSSITKEFFAKVQNKIAKNYLTAEELADLGAIVNAYLDLAERRAKRRIPMTMEDWANRLDIFLQADERELLTNAGKISAQIAKEHAESEFEKYRVTQDKLFENDFDKQMKILEQKVLYYGEEQ